MSTAVLKAPAVARAAQRWIVLSMLGPSLLILAVFLVAPLIQMADASFREESFGQILPVFTLKNFAEILTSALYAEIYLKTFLTAAVVTLLCAVIGFPVALHLGRAGSRVRSLLYFAIAAPLLVNTVVRTYGWLLILGRKGLVNYFLVGSGLIATPLALSGNFIGLIIGATQVFLPFMVLSVAASLQAIDPRLLEASEVLGASPLRRFWTVTLPLSRPGLIAGAILVFSLMLGAFVTPLVLGGTAIRYLSVAVYTDALVLFNLPRATALGMVLLLVVFVLFLLQSRVAPAPGRGRR